MDPVTGLVAGGATGVGVTLLVESVIKYTKEAVACKKECKELQAVVEKIRPNVERVEIQLQERRGAQQNHLQPLVGRQEAAEVWLGNVNAKMQEASIEVHECLSGTMFSRLRVFENNAVAKRIVKLTADIKDLAGSPATCALLSMNIETIALVSALIANGITPSPAFVAMNPSAVAYIHQGTILHGLQAPSPVHSSPHPFQHAHYSSPNSQAMFPVHSSQHPLQHAYTVPGSQPPFPVHSSQPPFQHSHSLPVSQAPFPGNSSQHHFQHSHALPVSQAPFPGNSSQHHFQPSHSLPVSQAPFPVHSSHHPFQHGQGPPGLQAPFPMGPSQHAFQHANPFPGIQTPSPVESSQHFVPHGHGSPSAWVSYDSHPWNPQASPPMCVPGNAGSQQSFPVPCEWSGWNRQSPALHGHADTGAAPGSSRLPRHRSEEVHSIMDPEWQTIAEHDHHRRHSIDPHAAQRAEPVPSYAPTAPPYPA